MTQRKRARKHPVYSAQTANDGHTVNRSKIVRLLPLQGPSSSLHRVVWILASAARSNYEHWRLNLGGNDVFCVIGGNAGGKLKDADCHEVRLETRRCVKMRLRPGTPLGELTLQYSAPPDPLAGIGGGE